MSPAGACPAPRQTGQHHGPAFAALSRIVLPWPDGFRGNQIQHYDEGAAPSQVAAPRGIGCVLQSVGAAIPDSEIAGSADTAICQCRSRPSGGRDIGRRVRVSCHLTSSAAAPKDGQDRPNQRRRPHSWPKWAASSASCRTPCGTHPLERGIFDTEWTESPGTPCRLQANCRRRRGSWLVLADATVDAPGKAQAKSMADDSCSSGAHRCGGCTADITTNRRCWPHLPSGRRPGTPVGVVVFVGGASHEVDLDASWRQHARRCGRSPRWFVRSSAWHGRSPAVWLVTRGGLSVADDEPGTPAASERAELRVLSPSKHGHRTT